MGKLVDFKMGGPWVLIVLIFLYDFYVFLVTLFMKFYFYFYVARFGHSDGTYNFVD